MSHFILCKTETAYIKMNTQQEEKYTILMNMKGKSSQTYCLSNTVYYIRCNSTVV